MKYWITTDTHFNHDMLIKYGRPENFEELIKKHLKQNIKPDDILIHLGDICIGDDKKNSNWFKENLRCKTILIQGNHDNKSMQYYMNNGWDICARRWDFKIFGKKICFSHMPVAWDGYFDINIHGHFHDTDHRRFEPEFNGIISGYNKLIALENTNYLPLRLKNII